MKVAIIGAGNVGGALASCWAAKGHEIVLGVKDPNAEAVKKLAAKGKGKITATGNTQAAAACDVVALCVPWGAAEEAVKSAGDLTGKILVDCTNPLRNDLKGLSLGHTTSAAEQVQAWTKAKVVKAFNTIGAADYGNADFKGIRADGFYCGDDAKAKSAIKPLIEDAGFVPVDVGPLSNARLLEPLAMLWIDLAINQGWGVNHGFKLLRR